MSDVTYHELDLDTADFLLGHAMTRQPEYLTKQEAAAYARVSVSTIERAIRAGELRAGGTPGRVLIRREWIDEWLEHRRVPARMRGHTV